MEINRIHHPYNKWEDHKAGFYNNVSGDVKNELKNKVVELFSSYELTNKYMDKAIRLWYYSCQHNLTNPSMNKIAYIGQAACCIFAGVPSTVTMEAWSLVPKELQEQANTIAENILCTWESLHINNLKQISNDNKC